MASMIIRARRSQGRRAAGQSLTEMVIIVFLVGIGAIGVVGLFGDNIRGLFGGSSAAIAGNSSVDNPGREAQQTKWDLRGGSLSAYNPAGVPNGPSHGGGSGGSVNSSGGSGGSVNSSSF